MAGNALLNGMGGGIPPMLQNNPFFKMAQMLKNGGNPQAMFQQIANQNPQLNQMANAMNGKSDSDIGSMMSQAAQQKGVDLGQLAKSIGMPEDVAKRYGIKMN